MSALSRRSLFVAVALSTLVAIALLAGTCSDPAPVAKTPDSKTYATPATPEAPEEPPPDLRYVDVTKEAGIDFVHDNGAHGKKYLPETLGAGCAFFDHDGDGDPDLLLLNGRPWPGHEPEGKPLPTWRFYRNDGGFRFTDVTADVGLDRSFYALGASAVDTDGDGDPDLFVAGVGGYLFFRNDGGRFVDVTAESGLDPGTWTDHRDRVYSAFGDSSAFLDYDNDGRPDLFVCHYVRWSPEADIWATLNGKDKTYATPAQYTGESPRLWRNLGGNRFEDVTDTAGIRNDNGKSLAVCTLDFDDDGWVDIAVANDTEADNLYRNNGDGTFTDVGVDVGISHGQTGRATAGMGIDAAPVAEKGRLAIAVGNFSGEPVSLFKKTGSTFINKSSQSRVSLVTHHPLTFSVRFLDADLDGYRDLILANGHIEPTVQQIHKEISYAQPMQLLHGRADGTFIDVSDHLGGDFTAPRVARALASADVDGDGDLDLCVTTVAGSPVLLRCDQPDPASRSLRIHVRGRAPATDALGARVEVEIAGRRQVDWVRTGGAYLAQHELTLTFGLGSAEKADVVRVRWPDGTERSFEDVPAGRLDAAP